MVAMEKQLGTMFILAGNYADRSEESYPDVCIQGEKIGLLIGAVDKKGEPISDTAGWEDSDAFAPGEDLPYPTSEEDFEQRGTSYGKSELGLCNFRFTMLTYLLLV